MNKIKVKLGEGVQMFYDTFTNTTVRKGEVREVSNSQTVQEWLKSGHLIEVLETEIEKPKAKK
jgi:hypothetical protein